MSEGSEWVPKKDGEWYQGADGMWYCWPSRDAYPMAPVNPDAPDGPDITSYSPPAAAGSVLAQVESGARPQAATDRNWPLLRLTLLGVLLLVTASVTAYIVTNGSPEEEEFPRLRTSVQEVSAMATGATRITMADGAPAISYAVLFRNLSQSDFARDVVLHVNLVDEKGAVVREVVEPLLLVAPGQVVAVAGETADDGRAVTATAGVVDIGGWETNAVLPAAAGKTVRVGPATDGTVDVTGRVVQDRAATPTALRAVVVFFDAQGNPLGGASLAVSARDSNEPFDIVISAREIPGSTRSLVFVTVPG